MHGELLGEGAELWWLVSVLSRRRAFFLSLDSFRAVLFSHSDSSGVEVCRAVSH